MREEGFVREKKGERTHFFVSRRVEDKIPFSRENFRVSKGLLVKLRVSRSLETLSIEEKSLSLAILTEVGVKIIRVRITSLARISFLTFRGGVTEKNKNFKKKSPQIILRIVINKIGQIHINSFWEKVRILFLELALRVIKKNRKQ
jgi:hypothetical protein